MVRLWPFCSCFRSQVVPTPFARINVGTWNVEHLTQKHQKKLQNLCATILASRISLLAIQEVCDRGALKSICEILGPHWVSITHDHPINAKAPYEYGGFIYDSRSVTPVGPCVSFDEHAMRTFVGKHRLFQRSPIAARFRCCNTNIMITLVSLHAKARDHHTGPVRDIYALWDVIQCLNQSSSVPVIVLGDFNTSANDLAAFSRWTKNKYVPALPGHVPTNTKGTQQYDNIWFHVDHVSVLDTHAWPIPSHSERTAYSNHRLVTSNMLISGFTEKHGVDLPLDPIKV